MFRLLFCPEREQMIGNLRYFLHPLGGMFPEYFDLVHISSFFPIIFRGTGVSTTASFDPDACMGHVQSSYTRNIYIYICVCLNRYPKYSTHKLIEPGMNIMWTTPLPHVPIGKHIFGFG